MTIKEQFVDYLDQETVCEGYSVTHADKVRPTVLICHMWGGLGDFEKRKCREIAELGYNAFAIDMYGKGIRGATLDENRALMAQYIDDREKLQQRIIAALSAARSLATTDTNNIAAIGYCFGGLCVLDLARTGADVKGVVSFHGLFDAPGNTTNNKVHAKVLALHGFEDPMVPSEKLTALANELTKAGADWQIHAYGNTYHSFTNPAANSPENGSAYNKEADSRSWEAMSFFLKEIFASD
ncbi:dienelactone hydrolase family protein [Aurantivibrio plasticivorans]